MSSSPGIILTCQYTLPNQKSFGDYLEYMTREEALENNLNRTLDQEIELQEIKSKIYNFEFFNGSESAHMETSGGTATSDMEVEAKEILKHSVNLEQLEDQDYTTYISYMARQYALEQKPELTKAELMEQEKISESLKKMNRDASQKKTPEFLPGVFSCSSDQVSTADLKEIKNAFRKGQNHGSVIYQDVISHDNSYLEKLGLYDSKTEKLDEAGLKRAGKEMMDKLFEKEKLTDTGFWKASIHRNTKHIHIHFAIVESQNTRPVITEKINGEIITMPKGKRKQSTLDEMKTAYSQELNRYSFEIGQQKLLDKRALLTRKSDLRNLLVKEVKEPRRYDHAALKILNEVYQGLPEKKSEWNYGTEKRTKLSAEVRLKLDQLTEHILTSDVRYKEYRSISDQLRKDAKETFGDSKRSSKDAQRNALFDLKKRTGNAILTSLKQQDQQMLDLIHEAKNLDKEKKGVGNVEEKTKSEREVHSENKTEEPKKSMESFVVDKAGLENEKPPTEEPKPEAPKTRAVSNPEGNSAHETVDQKKFSIDPNKDYFEALRGRSSERPVFSYNKNAYSYKKSSHKSTDESKRPNYQRRRLTRRSLRQVSNTIEAHEEKYQAQRAYEIQQHRIQVEHERS
ncbi:MobP2 family relaxase [Enterococcus gilvus]|uniref:MobP2 family relaxase n=1 Tax=Enterococcus gilvus TaxID=160453 RepID=UPI0028D09DB5|nr:MobP2 family relaxase [Enterococcus gilvus]